MGHRRPDSWPTRQQECLLRAALLQGRPALEAWEAWKAEANIAHVDAGSYRLLPLLYRALSRQRVGDPVLGILRGVYRRVWYDNQLLFHRVADVLRSFRENAIDVAVLKGAALAVLHYRDWGLRPMDDIDLLVRPRQLPNAVGVLTAAGFAPAPGIDGPQSRGFYDAQRRGIDLHWRVFPENPRTVSDESFWDGSVPITIHGVPACALNASDQLLHVCAHGVPWNFAPTIRWVADAMMILSDEDATLDWERLLAQARARRLTLPLRDALCYLKEAFDAPVPESVIQTLRGVRTSVAERLAYAASTRSHESRWPWWALYDRYRNHCARLPEGTNTLRRILGFPRFMQLAWGREHLWQVPAVGGGRALSWVKRIATRSRRQSATPGASS